MACCGKSEPDNPMEKRGCTDVIFCLIFLAFWVGMIAVAGTAFAEGDPAYLLYGIDNTGHLCGSSISANSSESMPDSNFKSEKNLHYLNPSEYSLIAIGLAKSVCVEDCPAVSLIDSGITGSAFVCEYYALASTVGNYNIDDFATDYYDNLNVIDQGTSLVQMGPCWPVWMPTTPFLNRCVPSLPTELIADMANSTALEDSGLDAEQLQTAVGLFSGSTGGLEDYIADLLKAWMVLVIAGVLCGLLFSMCWMILLRYFAGCMAWTTILVVNVVFIACTVYTGSKAGIIDLGNEIGADVPDSAAAVDSDDEKDQFTALFYVAAVLAAVCILGTLILFKRIKIAVACMKVASQAVAAMPSIIFFPVVTFTLTITLFIYWVLVASFLYAAGEIEYNSTLGTYNLTYDETLQYMMLYHLFGLLWTKNFIVGFGYMVIAGGIASFYWAGGDKSKLSVAPVATSAKTALWYHTGSIALGSFIVAVIEFVRIILEYIDQKTKKMQEGNPILKYAMCLVKYCMWYLEKVMKFINRNAYILVACKGYNYCRAAIRAVQLIFANILRLAAVNTVGDSLLFLGKIVVCLSCTFIAFLMCDLPAYTDTDSDTYLTTPLLPILVVMVLSWAEVTMFMSVYEMAIDTVLLCFCEDCESNGGNPKFAPKLLMDVMGQASPAAAP